MTKTVLTDVVADQYTRWMYPKPIMDLTEWAASNWEWFDPSHAHPVFWPDRDYNIGMDILVAGCGTNQAAVIAFTNPGAKVVAIDVSSQSLAHQRFLKEKHGLRNLELHLLPIEELNTLSRDFDLIISSGVLHHMASPQAGMDTLARCLRRDGVAAIMLYARHGRVGVDMLSSSFRDMGLRQDEVSVAAVREVLASLPQDHPVRAYLSIARDLDTDAGVVDTFLHGRERNYTIPECLGLVEAAGLVLQDLFFKAPYNPWPFSESPLHAPLSEMSREERWSVMERINFRNSCHFFMACRPDRDPDGWRIDFSPEASAGYVPAFRHRCHIKGTQVVRHGFSMELSPVQSSLLRQVDGRRSIKDIVAIADRSGPLKGQGLSRIEPVAMGFFYGLWQTDFLTMTMPR